MNVSDYLAGLKIKEDLQAPFREPYSATQRDLLSLVSARLQNPKDEDDLMDAIVTAICLIDAQIPARDLDNPKKCAKEMVGLIDVKLHGGSIIAVTNIVIVAAGAIALGAVCYAAYQYWKK